MTQPAFLPHPSVRLKRTTAAELSADHRIPPEIVRRTRSHLRGHPCATPLRSTALRFLAAAVLLGQGPYRLYSLFGNSEA
jgi:hypothetical protein